jgi:hypothetical protein
MSELVAVGLKLSPELRDRLKVRAAEDDTSVSALLVRGAEVVLGDAEASGVVGDLHEQLAVALRRAQAAEARIGELVNTVERLESGRGRESKLPIERKTQHPSGPVLKSAVPAVPGQAVGFNLKGYKP